MTKYIFTFDTEALYLAAKVSGGSIYAALQTATSGTPVCRIAVSYIKNTGATYTDAVNVIVPREEGGEIGDVLLYHATTEKYYWLKSKASWNASALGSISYLAALMSSFTEIGVVGYRRGRDCKIFSPDLGSLAWDTGCVPLAAVEAGSTVVTVPSYYPIQAGNTVMFYGSSSSSSQQQSKTIAAVSISGDTATLTLSSALTAGLTTSTKVLVQIPSSVVQTYSSAQRPRGAQQTATWFISMALEIAEAYYGTSGYGQYTYPFPRTAWEAMMEAVLSNTAGSGSSGSSWSWTVTAGTATGTASVTYVLGSTSRTVNPKDYGYDFARWYAKEVGTRFPASAGCFADMDGRISTAAIKNYYESHYTGASSTYLKALTACVTKNVTTTDGEFATGKWWLPAAGELKEVANNDKRMRRKNTRFTNSYYWSGTQYSALGAWVAGFSGANVYSNVKFYSCRVRACSAFRVF